MRFPDQQWAKWPASTMYRMSQHIQKTSLSTEKGEKTLFWENPDPFLGFPVESPPEQSFPPLVLLLLKLPRILVMWHYFLRVYFYFITKLLGSVLCLVSYSFSGGAKNLEATDGGLNLFFPETMTTFTSSHRLK